MLVEAGVCGLYTLDCNEKSALRMVRNKPPATSELFDQRYLVIAAGLSADYLGL